MSSRPSFSAHGKLDVPRPQGGFTRWVLEFKADGYYRFYDPVVGHAGTYVAQHGRWSQHATTTTYDDGGSYRLLDADTLELTGKLGSAVWKRTRDVPR